MLKKTLIVLTLPLLSVLAISAGNYTVGANQKISDAPTGTFQKMIMENGSVTMDLDLNGFNGSSSVGRKARHTAIRYRRQFILSHSSV